MWALDLFLRRFVRYMPEHIQEHPISDVDLIKAEERARRVLADMPLIYRFHTMPHTEAVVAAVREISVHEDITDHERRLVEAAAWFHDLGYLRSLAEHENHSAFSSLIYFMRIGVQAADIDRIEDCILATQLGREPGNVLEMIIADADMWHLTTPEFLLWADKLRREWSAMKGLTFTNLEWMENNIRFMRTVKFRTKYGTEVLAPRMEANIRLIEDIIAKGEY